MKLHLPLCLLAALLTPFTSAADGLLNEEPILITSVSDIEPYRDATETSRTFVSNGNLHLSGWTTDAPLLNGGSVNMWVDGDLTIQAPGQAEAEDSSFGRFFEGAGGSALTLEASGSIEITGGCVDLASRSDTSQPNSNGSAIRASYITISDNNNSILIHHNGSPDTAQSYGGALSPDGGLGTDTTTGVLTISGNNLVHFYENSSGSGAAIGSNRIGTKVNLLNNNILRFTNNTTISAAGGAMGFKGAQTDISGNGLVSFVGNTASTNGGAYHDNNSKGLLTVSNNKRVEFSNNSIIKSSNYGGAMYIINADFKNNDVITFSGNSSNYHSGAIHIGGKGKVSFSSTDGSADIVRFSGNYAKSAGGVMSLASGSSSSRTQVSFSGLHQLEFSNNSTSTDTTLTTAYKGGVFNANSYCTVELSNNNNVVFSGNRSLNGGVYSGSSYGQFRAIGNNSLIFADNHAMAGTGGVFSVGGTTVIDISGNKRAEFSHNTAAGKGGIICGGTLSFTNNQELLIRHNTAGGSGGAIYYDTAALGGNFTISGNRRVEFRGNAEGSTESGWLLRSIYAKNDNSSTVVALCATEATDSITFYDTVYVGRTFVTELNKGGSGRITFSGKYAAEDLAALGGGNLTASQTSIFESAVTIQGGVLEIADGAILQTPTLTTASGAATELNSGSISGALVINSGAALYASGSNTVSSALSMSTGSSLNLTLGAENLGAAALSVNSLSGLGNVNFSINSGDIIDGKYLVLTTNNGSGTLPANVSGLSWEGNSLYLTVSGSDNIWHVCDKFNYGTAVENSASRTISLDGGTMSLTKALAADVTLQSTADSTLELRSGVTLQSGQIARLNHGITLTGTGTYQLGNSSAMNASLADSWQGEVYVGDSDGSYTTMNGLDLRRLGNQDSAIRLQGVQGSLAGGNTTVASDLMLASGSGIAAVVIDSAAEGDSAHFSGNISSVGSVNFINDAQTNHSYEFSGDVSQWNGQIVSNTGTLNITYSGSADTIATDIRTANTGSGSTLNLKVENSRRVVFNGVVKDAPTWNTYAGRQLNLDINNAGNETVFRKGVEADSIRLSAESTLVAQAEAGSGRVSVTAAADSDAVITAVDITDTGLSLHSGDTTATRGRIENAAVILGEESAAVATAGEAIALADELTESYTVRNIDFANTTVAALAGTIAHVSGISLDRDSALVGDGSGNHLLLGSGNVLQLSAGDFVQDTNTEIYTYATTQLSGFTLGAGAELTLDAGLLSLPGTAPGNYTFNILLQDFSAADASPLIGITHAAWETDEVTAYTQSVSDRGVIVSFSLSSVPEPTTATLSLLALAGLALRRRRR